MTMPSIFYNKIRYKLTGSIRLKTASAKKGDALVSYITSPFLGADDGRHTNIWECRQIVSILLDMGYDVDIIDWDNHSFIPTKDYRVYLDIFDNLERLAPYLNKAVKIFHITGAHWQFMNHAEYSRLLDLKKRRGVALKPNRSVKPGLNIEYADYCSCLGNQFTIDTYAYAGKQISRIPISTTHTYSSPEHKDFSSVKNNFIWLGGSGMVHKGLDLVLEAFAGLPEHRLTVIGPVEKEADFMRTYKRELHETPNISLAGWLDLGSAEFERMRDTSVGIIYPSCSEGGGGSVITAMHAGLIPIVSRESSVDTHDFGMTLRDCSVEEIRKTIVELSSSSTETLKERAMASWEHANTVHTRESFTEAYRTFLREIVENKRP